MAIWHSGGAARGGVLIAATRGAMAKIVALPRIIAGHARADQGRWSLWIPVALAAGAGVYFALPFEPALGWAAIAAVFAMATGGLAAMTQGQGTRIVLALIAAFALGFGVARWRTEAVAAPVLTRQIGPAGIDGRIEFVQQRGKRTRLLLGDLTTRRLPPEQTPAMIRVSLRAGTEPMVPGEWVHVTAVLMPPPGPAAPDGYDSGREAYYLRIGGVGYLYGHAHPITPLNKAGFAERVGLGVSMLRWKITQRIHEVLPGSTGGIASALITGDRGAIVAEDEAALRDAGLAHVLAIAGLHMALVGLGLFWTVRAFLALFPALALKYPIKKWAAAAALASGAFYLVISGAATPATRAYIMLSSMLAAILFDRPALSMRSLALAAIVIILWKPENIVEPGFQMSFAAVASLIAVAEWEQRRRASRPNGPRRFATLRRYVHGIATTSLVGSLATAPYAVFHFERATHYAVLGNLLAMPIMGFVTMPAAALSLMLMPFGLDAWPLRAMGWGIETMLVVGRWVSGLPGAVSIVAAWPASALIVLSLGGLWVLIWRRSWRWLGLMPMAGAAAFAWTVSGPDLLVSHDARTVAVRGPDKLLRFVATPRDDYSAGEWLKRDGDARSLEAAMATPAEGVRCDGLGCLAQARGGVLVAVDNRVEALSEDCAHAAIVVAAVPAHRFCTGPKLIIDRRDTAMNGAYAVWFGKTIRVKTVEDERGLRPWAARYQYRRISPTSLP